MELTEVQKEADSAGRKAIAFGVGALLLAGLFGWMLAHLTSTGPETQPVVVAAQDIGPLSQLKLDELKVVQWPAQSMPSGTFKQAEDIIKTGLMNVNGLKAGEPVLSDRLSTADRGLGMSQMVEPNMRAFVVRVDDSVATSEILHPGAFVDVITTLEDPKSRAVITKLILQNVQVLGVGDSIEVERAKPRGTESDVGPSHDQVERHRVVTLAVHITDTEMLTFASRYGKIDLSLRNNNDNATTSTQGITMEKLLGKTKKEAAAADVSAESPDKPSSDPSSPLSAEGAATRPSGRRHRPNGSGAHSDTGPAIIRVNNH